MTGWQIYGLFQLSGLIEIQIYFQTVRLGRAKLVCTVHMSAIRAAPPTSHPTEPLVQSRHQHLHLLTDVECKVFLNSLPLVLLVLKLISLLELSLYVPQQMAGANRAIVS